MVNFSEDKTVKDSIFLFMQRYDSDGDGVLKYSDFCDAFTPKSHELATELHSRAPYNIYESTSREMFFSPETRALLRQAFKVHFEAEIN
jgi:hypothetical protein